MDGPKHLFFLIYNIFYGFFLSAAYGALTAIAVWRFDQTADVTGYLEAYFVKFNCALSGALVFATALMVYRTRHYIPKLIENTFPTKELKNTIYFQRLSDYNNIRKTITFSSSFAIIAFSIFYAARFPFHGLAEYFFIAAGCAQYAMGVYVGRKIFHIAHILRAIRDVNVSTDIFSGDKLAAVPIYVNAISTMAAIMVYVGVSSYYRAPFEYISIAGTSVKMIMVLPAVIALPVLSLFNYYPRVVVRRLYEKSIDRAIRTKKRLIQRNNVSEFEKLTYLLEVDRLSRDELNYRLRMTLADLPMAVTVGIALLSVFMR